MPKEVRSIVAYSDIVIGEDFNSRKNIGNLEELAESIKEHGLLQPLVVREGGPSRTDGRRKLFLVAGERRYRALGLLAAKQVEVKLVKGNTQEISLLNLIENEQRENLDPLEAAQAMVRYMEAYKCSQAELAKKLGKSEPYVSQRLSLLKKATPELKKAIESGKVTSTHAREIATLPAEQQKEVVDKIEKKAQETGKKPSTAEVKDETDRRKAAIRRQKEPDYDKEKVKAAKDAYDGVEMSVKSKQAILEQLALLIEKAQRAKTHESRQLIKGQIAIVEWVLGVREAIG